MVRLFSVLARRWFLLASAGFLSVVFLTGCQEPVDENHAIVMRLMDKDDQLDEDIKALHSQVKDNKNMLGQHAEHISKLQTDLVAPAPAAPDPKVQTELSALRKELAELRAVKVDVDQLKTQVVALQTALKEAKAAAAEATKAPATKTPAVSGPSTATGNAGTAPATASTAPSEPKGIYYTVKAGDTVESIARVHGISTAQLRAANRFPSGRNPAPNMRIWIPQN